MRYLVAFTLLVLTFTIAGGQTVRKTNYQQFVNPMIGTGATYTESAGKHGHGTENNAQIIPSVTVPFGMTNWTPQTRNSENKCVSPYYYSDSVITGFRGSHWLSGSCTQDYGSLTLMPLTGPLTGNPEKRGSPFSHKKEVASPSSYKVVLDRYKITTEMTATTRCGVFRFTFQDNTDAHIVINPNSDEQEGFIQVLPDKGEIVGYNPIHRIYQGKGKPAGFSGYFVVKISKVTQQFGVYTEDQLLPGTAQIKNKKDIGAYLSFPVKKGEVVYAKVGTSFTSIEQARKNLETEVPGFPFEKVRQNLSDTWEAMLSKIEVQTKSKADLVTFYTSLYHSFQHPRIYNDVDGQYPRFGGNAQTDTIRSGNYYCDFSLWDTFRALHPLFNLIIPDINKDMMRSLITMGKAGGWLPIFPKWNSYTSAMIGDHALSVIADAYMKGIIELTEEDYALLKQNAVASPVSREDYLDGKGRRGLPSYLKWGYIPLEDPVKDAFHKGEQVSRTLEYAYDDFCLGQIAKKMGKSEDAAYFFKRSQNYKNVYDASVNCMNGRFENGTFTKEFDRNKKLPFITEGTPWQYHWFVPQDIPGLMQLMGGQERFNETLDEFFATGQYWHGNEPGHQIPYLYTLSGQPWKTQKIVEQTLRKEYGNTPGGLSGNDDAGQMSAWYVFSSLGFYPVCPGTNEYAIGKPLFEKAQIHLKNNKTFTLRAGNNDPSRPLVQSIRLNQHPYRQLNLTYDTILKGGSLDFTMGTKEINPASAK